MLPLCGESVSLASIGFIPDGNRRYAQLHGMSLLQAYNAGTDKAWDVLEWITKYPQIKVGTFWMLSTENLARSKAELAILFRIFEKQLEHVKSAPIFAEKQIRLNFIGRHSAFPARLQRKLAEVEELTAGHKECTVNLALGYGGRAEIVDAAKKLAEDYKQGKIDLPAVNESTFRNYLYSDFKDPDLIVRTSGTRRLSGFLPYHSAYSELCFIDKHWPELTEQDVARVISDFESRERRFGR